MLFQPHRYTRTQHLWDDFCRAFNQADVLVLTDIYPAGEAPIPGITAERARPKPSAPPATRTSSIAATLQESIEYLLREARPGDAVLAIGAGNVNRALGELAMLLGARQQPTASRHAT